MIGRRRRTGGGGERGGREGGREGGRQGRRRIGGGDQQYIAGLEERHEFGIETIHRRLDFAETLLDRRNLLGI